MFSEKDKIGAAELISMFFGTLGMVILLIGNQDTSGTALVSSALTSYFAYKRGEEVGIVKTIDTSKNVAPQTTAQRKRTASHVVKDSTVL